MEYFLYLLNVQAAPAEQSPGVPPETLKALAELIKAAGVVRPDHSWFSAEQLKAVAELVSAVAWPVAVVMCAIIFRKPLIALLGHVQSVKAFGAEISLQVKEELAQSAQEASGATGLSLAPSEGELARAEIVSKLTSGADIAIVRGQAEELAREYEQVRHSMRPSDTRTRRMEVVVSKMRTIARAFYPLRNEFANSTSPGQRLVAIAALQVDPDYDMLGWLADRLRPERPFISYHALVALLLAIRAPNAAARIRSIQDAMAKLQGAKEVVDGDTDRAKVLADIENAVASLPGVAPPT